jgi:hypothetical protein
MPISYCFLFCDQGLVPEITRIKSFCNSLKGGTGVSFQFRHPKDAQAYSRPQSGQASEDRHKECPSLWRDGSVGLLHNLHKFGAVPPLSDVTESVQDHGIYFQDRRRVSMIQRVGLRREGCDHRA